MYHSRGRKSLPTNMTSVEYLVHSVSGFLDKVAIGSVSAALQLNGCLIKIIRLETRYWFISISKRGEVPELVPVTSDGKNIRIVEFNPETFVDVVSV